MTSATCPTCGGEFHSVKLREEAMEYALAVLEENEYGNLCSGCKKMTQRVAPPPSKRPGAEGVVVTT